VYFELNGVSREVRVFDRIEAEKATGGGTAIRRKPVADKSNAGHGRHAIDSALEQGRGFISPVLMCAFFALSVGAPMPGTVVSKHCKVGDVVTKGQKIAVLSAMKMETVVSASKAGTVKAVYLAEGDLLSAGDLVVEIA